MDSPRSRTVDKTATGDVKMQTQKSSNEHFFILTRTHSMHIFGEIPFVKPQNDTQTTDKRLKMMKNEREKGLVWLSFLFSAWKNVGTTIPYYIYI